MKQVLTLIPLALIAASPSSPHLTSSAFTQAMPLNGGEKLTLEGRTDRDEAVVAEIAVTKDGTKLSSISVKQDDQQLILPAFSYDTVTGARRAWLEERGALTTLVIEGNNAGKDWQLALEFHPKQLWLRRLSVEGENRDHFTFYRGDKLEKTREFRRHSLHRRFES
jgi:hypothetical protein